nr:hypothetical protein [Tanacetum cinerariifolium]
PEAPPSPDYIPGPEAPPSPDYVPGPEYLEYLPPADDDDADDEDEEESSDSEEEEEEHLALTILAPTLYSSIEERERRYFRTLSTTYAQEVAHSRDYCTQIMDYFQSREALIDQGVAGAMAEAKASRVRNGYGSNGSGPRLAQAVRECT